MLVQASLFWFGAGLAIRLLWSHCYQQNVAGEASHPAWELEYAVTSEFN